MEYVSTVRKYAHSHRPMCFFFSYFPSFFFFRSVHTSIFNEFLFIQIYTVEYIEDFWVKFYLLKFVIRCDKPHSFSPTHGCEIDASKNWVNQVKRVWKEKLERHSFIQFDRIIWIDCSILKMSHLTQPISFHFLLLLCVAFLQYH